MKTLYSKHEIRKSGFSAKHYIRVGSTKQVPTQQELLRFFQKRIMLQFDETPVIKASVHSIDKEKVDAYLAELGQSPLNDSLVPCRLWLYGAPRKRHPQDD